MKTQSIQRMVKPQFPFSISDPKSPYFITLLKSLDVLTTWMFLSQGIVEGNPFAREGIRLYGILPIGLFALGTTFVYTLVLHILWNHVDDRKFRVACNFSFNFGVVLDIVVPFYNWVMMYAHFLS